MNEPNLATYLVARTPAIDVVAAQKLPGYLRPGLSNDLIDYTSPT